MAGVEVHANILGNLLAKDYITRPPDWIKWLASALLSALLFFLFLRTGEKTAAILWMLGLLTATLSVFILFSFFHIWTGPALFYFCCGMYF